MDLKNEDGMLDRGKVMLQVDLILSGVNLPSARRTELDNLMDEMVDQAFMDGMDF